MESYPYTTPSKLHSILSHVPESTRQAVLTALKANGLLPSEGANLGVRYGKTLQGTINVDANRDQLVLLGRNSSVHVNSNGPIIVASQRGANTIDISHKLNKSLDQADTVIGGAGRDTIVGNSAASKLIGGSGREQLLSGGGQDTLVGGSGFNTITAGGQSLVRTGVGESKVKAGNSLYAHDTVQAGAGSALIKLKEGNNVVKGPVAGGMATIRAGSGYDTIYGPAAGQGNETIKGGAHTTLEVGTGAVKLNLGKGDNDTVFGSASSGFVNLNKNLAGATQNPTTTADGQKGTVFTFKDGSSLTAIGGVNLTFADTRHKQS